MVSAESGAPGTRRGRARALLTALQVFVVAGALVSLAGWAFDVPSFADWDGDGITIQPNSCVAAACAGLGVLCLAWGRSRAARGFGLVPATLGGATLFQYATGTHLGIDELLMFGRTWGQTGVLAPGRMGPPGATSWTVLGIAIVLASRAPLAAPLARTWASALALTTTAIASLSLIGYLYGAGALYSIPTLTVIAKQTAMFLFCASLGLVVAIPERGLMRLVFDTGSAGILARRLLPAIVVLPIVIGMLRIAGFRANLYDAEFGTALRTLVEIGLLLLFLWWCAGTIRRQEQRREEADAALVERERDLREAQRTAQVGSFRWDVARDAFTASEELARIFGWPADARFPGWRAQDGTLYPRASWTKLDAAVRRAVDEGAGFELDLEALRGGAPFWVAVRAEVERGADGRVSALRGTIQDVTAREQVYERERDARAEAERAVRMKDEFLATLSHELRTPLNAMLGWSQILRHDADDPRQVRSAAEVIERNGRLQAQLITDLLDMSRILSGKMRLEVQTVELDRAVHAAVESISPAAQAKGVAIERSTEPVRVQGDPGRLQQVAWNLLSNAVKFTPRGGRVRVEVIGTATHAEIRVTDTGEGIAPEFVPHLFERFRQADASTSRSHGGLGIGLALVKQIVELHGGRAHAASEGRGRGATFVVELPLQGAPTTDAPREDDPTAPRESKPCPPQSLRGVSVLVVDDEPDALSVALHMLEDCDAEVVTAESAAEALALLEERAFDVVVSDLGMPGIDGHGLVRTLRERGDTTPAIALSAFAGAQDRAASAASGFCAHLSKPVESADLIRAVATASGRSAETAAR